ncbi:ATP-binding protein, partial [Nocardia farcinica]|uniref:ATP-binding protein n=1 Tax=Nocardia farcinica TaxID=37329 RepID=UPI001E5CCBCA
MPTSYYLGPRQQRFTPSGWTDIEMASNSGLFDETQWVERKKDIPPTSGPANLELARDLASLSVDGGVLIVGIQDSQKGVPGAVTGSVEKDLADRIAQVARRSNDQNLWIPGGRAFPEDDRRSHRILIKTSVGALAGRHARAH